jgi:hypothetical protein
MRRRRCALELLRFAGDTMFTDAATLEGLFSRAGTGS